MPKGIPRNQTTQNKILHRLKIARGHLDKVITMVTEDTYCIDVIHQSQAVQHALQQTDIVIYENHLRTCVAEAIRNGNDTEVIQEIIEVIKRKAS